MTIDRIFAPTRRRLMLLAAAFSLAGGLHADPAAAPVPQTGYLFAHFYGNGESGLHLAWSADGLDWHLLNDGESYLRPEVGESRLMRDPSLIRGPDGVFHMVWTTSWSGHTIGYASSPDLLEWSPQRALPVMAHEPRAENCWAPEIIWDPTRATYLILWSTTIPGKFPETALSNRRPSRNHRIFSTTTRDFEAFTPARLHYDGGFNVIDAVLGQTDGDWIMFVKDETLAPETQKNIRMLRAPTPYGPFSAPSRPLSTGDWSEGPSIIRVGEYYHLYYDQHMIDTYGLVRSRDLENWEAMDGRTRFPADANHGSFVEVPGTVIARLIAAGQQLERSADVNVLDHGAVPDGAAPGTDAIRAALAACAASGGGRVHFPSGSYMTDTIDVPDRVELVFADGAALALSGDAEPGRPLLRVRGREGVVIRGGSLSAGDGGPALHIEDSRGIRVLGTRASGRRGIIIDNVTGLELRDTSSDSRELPAFLIMNAVAARLEGLSSTNTSNEPILSLHNGRDVVLADSRATRGNRTFIQILGSGSENIRLRDNDFTAASAPVKLGPDVFAGRVTMEGKRL
jgi:hypothetical protein